MLNALLDLIFKKKSKQTVQKKRHLSISTQYKYPASNLPANTTPDVSQLYKDVSNLPQMRNAHVSVCEIDKGTKFTGFNRPKKVLRHIVVYPNEAAEKDRTNLLKVAQKNNLSVALLTSHTENQCIRVAKDKHVFFLIKPASVRLHSWVYKPTPQGTTTLLSKTGITNLHIATIAREDATKPITFSPEASLSNLISPKSSSEQTLIPRRR